MVDILLFNSLSGYPVPSLSAGPYRIASVLRQEKYNVKIIDHFEWLLKNDFKDFYDILSKLAKSTNNNLKLIGISTTWLKLHEDQTQIKKFNLFLKILKTFFPNSLIIFGGNTYNSKIMYKLFGDMIDFWIEGLGESAIVGLLKNGSSSFEYKEDKKQITFDPLGKNFDFRNSAPLFHKTDTILEGETLPIEITRGCRFRCKFCTFPLLGRNPHDHSYIRSTESLAREFAENYSNFKTKNYFMLCDTFNESTDKLINIRKALDIAGIDKINFFAYLRADLLHVYPEQIDILKNIGLKAAIFGIESLNDASAKSIGKGLGAEKILKIIKKAKKVWGDNTFIYGSFIIGLPHENYKTLEEWTTPILNGDSPFHSYEFNTLTFWNDVLHKSEFSKNPEKYGYTMKLNKNNLTYDWNNKAWNNNDCNIIKNHYEKISIEKNTNGVTPYMVMGLKTLGWNDDDIKKLRFQEISSNTKVINDKEKYFKKYFDKLKSTIYQ